MYRYLKRVLIVEFFMAISLMILPQTLAGADEGYVLPNGLKVILAPQPSNPVISARVMVKTGSASENGPAEFGLAHLMEHMAFKGTARRAVGEISSLVENNGGSINAYTGQDETVYHLSLPSESVELALDILSDLVFFPTYDPEEYRMEKEVVVEEIKRASDNPDRLVSDEFFRLAYPHHPYEHRVLGSEESVREAGRDTAFGFHNRYYRPDNAILVVAGGFDPDAVKVLVEKYYLDVKNPPEALKPQADVHRAPKKKPSISILTSEQTTVPKVLLAFNCPGGRESEAPQLDLLSSLLSQGRASRLIANVKIKKGLVSDIGSYALTPVLEGSFITSFEAEPEQVVPALEAVLGEFSSLVANPPSLEELTRARLLTEKNFLDSQQSASNLASQLASFELLTGDYRLRDAYLPQWSRVTADDLVRLSRKVFRPENLTLVVMLPESASKLDEKNLNLILSSFSLPQVKNKERAEMAFESFTLTGGSRLLVMHDASLPVVSVKVGLMGGLLAEKEGQEGLSNIMADVWPKSISRLSSEEMARAIENLGAELDGFAGRNSIGLSASFLSSNWREGMSLLVEAMTDPAFSEIDLEESRQEIMAAIKMQDEQLPERTFRILRREIFGTHPYSNNPMGTIETVSKFTREELFSFYKALVRPEQVIVAVAGDVEPQAVREVLEEALKNWKPEGTGLSVDIPTAPKALDKLLTGSEILDRAQTHLALAFLVPGLADDDQASLDVLDSYLSGMGGILFSELREKRSLAYTVTSGFSAGLKTGTFNFYIATDPQKTEGALTGILDIVERIKANDIAETEVAGARRYLAGLTKIRRQTLASRVDQAVFNELYGLGQDYDRLYLEAIERVTPADLKRVANKYLDVGHMALSVVGNSLSVKQSLAVLK